MSNSLNRQDSAQNESHDPYLKEYPEEFYLHPDLEEKMHKDDEIKENQIFKRAIVHPRFKNIDSKTAEEELKPDTVPVGYTLFRPSSRGYSHLSITWKFYTDVFVHIEIEEQDKPNNWSLGKKLKIADDVYDDLDDVMANFIDPLVNLTESIVTHRRFKAGRKHEIDMFLAEAKNLNPQDLPYALAIHYESPGRFLICYRPYKKVIREVVTVTPKGLRYRKRLFLSAQSTIDHFKRHWNDAKQNI